MFLIILQILSKTIVREEAPEVLHSFVFSSLLSGMVILLRLSRNFVDGLARVHKLLGLDVGVSGRLG